MPNKERSLTNLMGIDHTKASTSDAVEMTNSIKPIVRPRPPPQPRTYRPKRRRHPNMSLILNKSSGFVQNGNNIRILSFIVNSVSKKPKSNKQCPFFSRTGE